MAKRVKVQVEENRPKLCLNTYIPFNARFEELRSWFVTLHKFEQMVQVMELAEEIMENVNTNNDMHGKVGDTEFNFKFGGCRFCQEHRDECHKCPFGKIFGYCTSFNEVTLENSEWLDNGKSAWRLITDSVEEVQRKASRVKKGLRRVIKEKAEELGFEYPQYIGDVEEIVNEITEKSDEMVEYQTELCKNHCVGVYDLIYRPRISIWSMVRIDNYYWHSSEHKMTTILGKE